MKFHPGNRDVYEEIKENLGQLLPFVGAGLTTPFYGTWSEALNNLGKQITNEADRDELFRLVKTDYLGAAQFLEDKLGPHRLIHQMVRYFDKDKLDKREETGHNRKVFVREALYLLPKLFSCPILTTNFDEGVEKVYEWRCSVLDPSSHNLREQARRLANTPCVFKLHGSVEASMADYDKLVFTEKQYERHYAPDGEARAALSEFANGRVLLFLGCSLQQDKTVDLLREQAGMGTLHYAIVHCEGKDKDTRLRELDNLGIQAILYPVEDHNDNAEGKRSERPHIAVRIILEQLLQDLHPDEYKTLNSCYSALPKPTENPYVYRARMTPLLGRDTEMNQLIQFVTGTEDPFRWWAVTGPSGSGKSKLAMELKDRVASMDGWTCVTLETEDYKDLKGFFARYTCSTLVVADYVQAHARELGEQMEALARARRTHPLRLLLVERNDPGGGFGWTEQLYDNVHHKAEMRSLCWDKEFLTLSPLEDKELIEIIRSFAKNLRNRGFTTHSEPTEKDCLALLDCLKAIDKAPHRPLYALALTGAWMEGENPAHWSQNQVLDYIVERECTLLDERLRELTNASKKNEILYEAILHVYCLATAMLGPKWKIVERLCPEDWKDIQTEARAAKLKENADNFLSRAGLMNEDTLVPMEPDLMGEYFVYQWLTDKAEPKERQDFLKAVWGNPHSAAIFFNRLFIDYAYQLNGKPEQWELLLPPLEDLVPDPDEKDSWWYAALSKNAVYYCTDLVSCAELADHLMKVKNRFPNIREILLELAGGLVNLMCKQDCNGRMATFSQQEELIGLRWKTDSEFAQELAVGLGNLSNKQDENGIKDTVLRLENLRKKWPDDLEIARELANGLTHLIKMQSPIDAKRTFNRLLILREQFPKDRTLSWQIIHANYHL